MISELFKKLAADVGINWFNHKEKISYEQPVMPERLSETDKLNMIRRQRDRYFKRMWAQHHYITVMHKLIDQIDFEIEKWDLIQAGHEQEMNLEAVVRKKDKQIAEMTKPVISEYDVNRLLNKLDNLDRQPVYARKHEIEKYKQTQHVLHNFLQKLQPHVKI